ncbi:predicted GPI-anchored protein 58 [Lemur catta]|uniref:predicted GPI-anchored protein 58 n=1 Tax=Lemur catta TaxID=9447 RepID=UPI001E26DE89|nr:predicted GPI-anchored protein 58 [Lemur catta]
MVRATAAPAARPNLAVAPAVRLALPRPRTTSAARRGTARRPRGRGRGALPTRGSAEATSAPHLYVTGSASARSIHGPGSAAPPPLAAAPAPRRPRSPDGRAGPSEPAPLERCHTWRSQVYSTENAPEALGEATAGESERPCRGEVRLELRRAANPTVLSRCLVLPLQPRTPTVKRVTAGRQGRGSRSALGAPPGPVAGPGPPPHVPARGAVGRIFPSQLCSFL